MLLFPIFSAFLTCAWLLMPSVLNIRAGLFYSVFECHMFPSEIPNSAFVQYFTQLYINCIFRNFLLEVGFYLPFGDEEIKIPKSKITQKGVEGRIGNKTC